MEKWVLEEFASISLGDERLNRRAERILSNLSSHPSGSIPTACNGWAETKAAYRFLDNAKVNSKAILSSHQKATLSRVKQYERVFVIQDTTELNYSGQKQKQGVGPSKRDSHQALFLTLH
jgi:hypothetical protein